MFRSQSKAAKAENCERVHRSPACHRNLNGAPHCLSMAGMAHRALMGQRNGERLSLIERRSKCKSRNASHWSSSRSEFNCLIFAGPSRRRAQ